VIPWGIRVREASTSEAPALAALQRRTALVVYDPIFPAEAPKPDLDQMTLDWQQRLSGFHSPNTRGFVAVVDGNLQTGVIVASGDPDNPDFGHITRFYVDPKEWGQGVGRALYDAALSYLIQTGYAQGSLWVLEQNERARSWYERLGWTCTGESKSVLGSGRIADVRYVRLL
jgi:ribosomal protein S18 acetylase RimI-like enzyme